MHGRHRAGGGARGARPLPASGAHRPARGARGAGAGGDPPPARQRDRGHAGARDRAALGDICPYRLRAPLAPAVAARLEGVTIEVARLVALVARRRQDADVLLVEGAGGLLVPLDGQTTYAELAVRAGLPLLIVGANRLGTVNHCALTARLAAAAGVVGRGFVLSQPTAETHVSAATNAET